MAKHGKQLHVSIDKTTKLKGTSYDVRQLDSIAILLVQEPSLRGLYRLSFSNGDSYVGQAVNVVNRFTSHRRRWNDIDQFEFFPIPTGDLNQTERELIHTTELNGSVRNIRDAHQPRGRKTIELEVAVGETVLLPWDRDQRIRPGDQAISKERQNFFRLATHERYEDIRFIAGWYLYNLIPDPFNTQKHLWVSTAMPSTNRTKDHQRLAVINTGSLETLCFMETTADDEPGHFYDLFINTVPHGKNLKKLQSKEGYWIAENGEYPYGKVSTWTFSLDSLIAILTGEIEFPHMDLLLDTAYELNVRLMRQNAGGMFRRFHNEMLANDFLAASLNEVGQ